jgi:hypothetical protein
VDDLNMGISQTNETWGDIEMDWGLTNFVLTPKGNEGIKQTGIKLENVIFYQLYALVTNDQNVFMMKMFNDGYALWFLNELTPEEIRVTEEHTYIGVTSVLHLEEGGAAITKISIPTATGSYEYKLS